MTEDANDPTASVIEVGPRPEGATFPRWVHRAGVPDRPLPPVLRYTCHRVDTLAIDGDIDSKPWPWSEPFRDMATGETTPHAVRAAMLWNDEFLFVAFDLVDPDRVAIATEPGTHVYKYDTAAEILISGPGGYYEFGLNSIGVGYEVAWHWVDQLFDNGDKAGIDRLLRLPNFIYYLAQGHDRLGRVGNLDYRMPGLIHSETWAERHGSPGWTVEIALPWEGLAPVLGFDRRPSAGSRLRVQAFRSSPSNGWTWSVQGNSNVHNLERWAEVDLSSEAIRS